MLQVYFSLVFAFKIIISQLINWEKKLDNTNLDYISILKGQPIRFKHTHTQTLILPIKLKLIFISENFFLKI